IAGRPEIHETELRFVTPGYFRAMGIPLRRGREFSLQDIQASSPGVLINDALARYYFPNEDPVARRTDLRPIIGLVANVSQTALNLPPKPEMYFAGFAQIRRLGSTLVVRGDRPPEALIGAIRAAIREVSPSQALFRVATMESVIDESLANQR